MSKRSATIVLDGRTIFQYSSPFPAPAAKFDDAARKRVINQTRMKLLSSVDQELFWRGVASSCQTLAAMMQLERRKPTVKDYKHARTVAKEMQVALRPFLQEDLSDKHVDIYGRLQVFIEEVDEHNLAEAKPWGRRRIAPAEFVWDIGGLFAEGFGRAPSTAAEGIFARFVTACLDETEGLPEPVSSAWVQKWVRARRNTGARYRVGRLARK